MRIQAKTLSLIYFAGLVLLCIGLPLSKFLMSVSQFVLLASWLLEGAYKKKVRIFFQNKIALCLAGVFVLHVVGMLYSTDLKAGWNDIRIKLPLLVLPFIISTSPPLSLQRFNLLMGIFVGAVLISTGCSIAVLRGYTHFVVNDIRDISIFISHIRFSLLICLAMFTLLYALYQYKSALTLLMKGAIVLLCLWFVLFLFILESVTGILLFFTIGWLLIGFLAFKQKRIFVRLGVLLLLIATPLSIYLLAHKLIKDFEKVNEIDTAHLDRTTALGNLYEHHLDNFDLENGNRLYLYLCPQEMEAAWNRRSVLKFKGKDLRNQDLNRTIVRFLTSKNVRKDAAGINSLSDAEIHSIEKGIANVNYQNVSNFRSRMNQILYEYAILKKKGNPSGHSVTQRLEFWKAAVAIIKDHTFTGVGTGDVEAALGAQYQKMQSPLEARWRLHAHNQYLSIFIAFGLFGFAYFIFSLFYPLYKRMYPPDYFYVVFWALAVLSMLTEDTLETQAGATFFAFFNALFLFAKPSIKSVNEHE
jgi:hypothetical protein